MRLNIVGKETVPEPPYQYELVCVPVDIIPQLLGAIWLKSQKYWYATPEDWYRGRSLLAELSAGVLMSCGTDIIAGLDRISLRLDTYLGGIERNATVDTTAASGFAYVPELMQSPSVSDVAAPSLWTFGEATRAYLDNLTNGTVSSFASDPRNIRQQLEDILAALQADDADLEEIGELLGLILAAL